MVPPVILSRPDHRISRQEIDPDALKVLYRLHEHHHVAYLVGGSVRDLLLGRRPKDFDIGTSAHPYQVKKLFRNCWIIGKRFRLAHVRFGTKAIEVATFRRLVAVDEAIVGPPPADADSSKPPAPADRLIHRDNTFGTAEEDAFRRDFTINALFYNIADFSIIDYTGGLRDLEARVIRCIGDPNERFREDPVRMTRAVAMAARLDFTIDPPIDAAIQSHREQIGRSSPARLLEEFYKILRTGQSARAFRMMAERRLLEVIAPPLQEAAASGALEHSLEALDNFRGRSIDTPDTLTNTILLGTLLRALPMAAVTSPGPPTRDAAVKTPRPVLGMLPLARRDLERLEQVLGLQRRMEDLSLTPRARRALAQRAPFREALTWLEIHGQAPEALGHWRGFLEAAQSPGPDDAPAPAPSRQQRRRRRRHRGGSAKRQPAS